MAPDSRIFIVEDEQDFRETLVEIFTIQGYDVVVLEGLAEFRHWFASESFYVAVLDRTLGNPPPFNWWEDYLSRWVF